MNICRAKANRQMARHDMGKDGGEVGGFWTGGGCGQGRQEEEAVALWHCALYGAGGGKGAGVWAVGGCVEFGGYDVFDDVWEVSL